MKDKTTDTKKTLELSENQLRWFVAASSELIYRVSADWQQMYMLTGRDILKDTEQPNANWMKMYIPEADRPQVRAAIREAITNKKNFELEHRVVQANGSIGWTFSRAVPILDKSGQIEEWIGAASDITERKHHEQHQTFMLKLSDELRYVTGSAEIERTAMRVLGEELGVDRAFFATIGDDGKYWSIRHDYKNGLPGSSVQYPISEFQQKRLPQWQLGQMSSVADSETDPSLSTADRAAYATFGIRAAIGVPLVKGGRFAALLSINQSVPREWTKAELLLASDTAERTWAAIERAKTEEALHESEERYRVLAETAPVLIWQNNSIGEIFFINRFFLDYTGKSEKEIRGEGWHTLIHPDDMQEYVANYLSAVAEQRHWVHRNRIRQYNGEWHWFENYANPVFGEDGRYLGHVGVSTDVNSSVMAESALRISEEKYRGLFENIDQGFSIHELITDESGNVTDVILREVNEAFEQHTGIKNAQGKKVSEIVPNLEPVWLDAMTRAYKWGETQRFEAYNSDTNRWTISQYSRIGGAGSRLLSTLFNDITERKNAEERLEREVRDRTIELKQSRDHLQSILDTTLVQMSILEAIRDEKGNIADFKINLVNKELERITGRTDLVGKTYTQEYPGVRAAGVFDMAVKTIQTGEPQQLEYYYTHEGFKHWFTCMFVKLNDGVVASNMDITAPKQAEDERFKNYTLLQQSEDVALLGSWEYSLLTGTFTWSDGMYRLFDLEQGKEIQPEIYLEYTTENGRPAARRIVDHIRTGDTDFEETLELDFSGNVKVLHIKAALITNNEGHATRVLGIDIDISATRAAEEKIRRMEAEQRLEIFRISLSTLEEERHRIAESLHNGIGQILYGVKLSLAHLNPDTDTAEFIQAKTYTSKLLTDVIVETRRISHELMPTTLEQFGLKSAIDDVCEQLSTGIKLTCKITGMKERLEKYLELAVYRTTQELMTNIIKHANATEARINIAVSRKDINITVSDNGQGITAGGNSRPGIGLASIRSKIGLLNGKIAISSGPGKGTTISIFIPVASQQPDFKIK